MSANVEKNILAIDDDPEIHLLLESLFLPRGYQVHSAHDAAQGLELLKSKKIKVDLILCDLMLPDANGIELIEKIRDIDHSIPLIFLTAFATIETAVEALERGAHDYITKPINLTELYVIATRAIEHHSLQVEYRRLQNHLSYRNILGGMISRSPKMHKIFDLIKRISKTNTTVLIHGESGTGKEMVAKAIHDESDRREKPFVAINCSAIPESLLESELFGYKRGAFTGAGADRKGLFEEAHEGTLFLDEIGDLPQSLQAKLLRVLQERTVRKIGENTSKEVDVRVVTATHKNLRSLIQTGDFREDLFYRLCVIQIEIPALKDRMEDMPLLVEHFIKKYCAANKIPEKKLSKSAVAHLLSQEWKGNVRELENAIERAVVLSPSGYIEERDLQSFSGNPKDRPSPQDIFVALPTLEELEKNYIQYVLTETGDHKEKAAEILGINRKTLYRKGKNYGFTV